MLKEGDLELGAAACRNEMARNGREINVTRPTEE